MRPPTVAVTVSLYVPAGVPPELFREGLEPPQEHSNTSNGRRKKQGRRDRLGLTVLGIATHHIRAKAHSQGERTKPDRPNLAAVCGVVVTLTFRVEASVALTNAVAGTEQFAPLGAPLQL